MPVPRLLDTLEFLKPVTWFAPMWAFGCGAVSSGQPLAGDLPVIAAGIALSGPLLCASSQAVNDWQDRHVDAINEPERPIPSGRISPRWGAAIAVFWALAAALVAASLGPWVFAASLCGLILSWAYSTPPVRLKRNGWWGNAAVALSYEGLAWFAGAALLLNAFPDWRIVLVAAAYSVGAHGIMTLNDFKAVEGDRATGIRSLPARLGVGRAARLACAIMALAQLLVVACLAIWGEPYYAGAVFMLVLAQGALMPRFLARPRERAPWYNATGTTLYVAGMLVAAFALGAILRGAP